MARSKYGQQSMVVINYEEQLQLYCLMHNTEPLMNNRQMVA
ncbi:hypothetical protein QQM79_00030 [Marinobacteraceae bacterium S3BR75-40.1]